MSDTMTLADVADWMDSFQRTAVDPACSEVRLRRAATVRAADEIIERCRLFIEASTPDSHKSTQLLADIRKIRGGGQ